MERMTNQMLGLLSKRTGKHHIIKGVEVVSYKQRGWGAKAQIGNEGFTASGCKSRQEALDTLSGMLPDFSPVQTSIMDTIGPRKATAEKTQREKAIDAHQRGSHWLAEGNEAEENGNTKKAEKCFKKAQYWLDRLNVLEGYGNGGNNG